MQEDVPAARESPGLFSTTEWSLVLAAGDSRDPDSDAALAALCGRYWYPVYALVRHLGNAPESARDLTQGFFTHLLEKHSLSVASPDRGRFRSFLKISLRNYLDHERHRAQAQKRGGRMRVVGFDFDTGERRYTSEPTHHETPETVFEKRWARTLLNRSMDRLRNEMQDEGRGELFHWLSPFLTDETKGMTYRESGGKLELSEAAVKGAVHRMRKRFGRLLREEVSHTLADADDVEKEIRHLFAVMVA